MDHLFEDMCNTSVYFAVLQYDLNQDKPAMESPPSTSIWSEAFILSDDSGLLLTSSSISSGESRTGMGQFTFEVN